MENKQVVARAAEMTVMMMAAVKLAAAEVAAAAMIGSAETARPAVVWVTVERAVAVAVKVRPVPRSVTAV